MTNEELIAQLQKLPGKKQVEILIQSNGCSMQSTAAKVVNKKGITVISN